MGREEIWEEIWVRGGNECLPQQGKAIIELSRARTKILSKI
jgi:hypothetical protein